MSHDTTHGGADGHGEHAHMRFQAHHFDDPEQQFDAGKLGMWLFLVTEVLFFSGMFCAYALYRSLHPEVWTFSSQFLNANLGAFNTCVLLFSSLTMAWGVRCAQLRQRKGLVICLAMTLGCAAIFLGVKAVEYTHKWDMGLLPAGAYESQFLAASAHYSGFWTWLRLLGVVPALFAVGFAVWLAVTIRLKEARNTEVAGSLLATALCYFLGVYVGVLFQNAEGDAHGGGHPVAAHAAQDHDNGHEDSGHDDVEGSGGAGEHAGEEADGHHDADAHGAEAQEEPKESDQTSHADVGTTMFVSTEDSEPIVPGAPLDSQIDQRGGAGLFFSIYYCMTGVHAIHILGGMVVLTWLLIRASKDHFNEQYFGPVDYVGLYWHIVDLIWIFLFPLLYLI